MLATAEAAQDRERFGQIGGFPITSPSSATSVSAPSTTASRRGRATARPCAQRSRSSARGWQVRGSTLSATRGDDDLETEARFREQLPPPRRAGGKDQERSMRQRAAMRT